MISDLEVFRDQVGCPAKEADMSGHFGQKKIWKLYKIRLLKDLAYRPIVVHILVINGQVLKIKTYIYDLKAIRL
jgi:hypothetical protein